MGKQLQFFLEEKICLAEADPLQGEIVVKPQGFTTSGALRYDVYRKVGERNFGERVAKIYLYGARRSARIFANGMSIEYRWNEATDGKRINHLLTTLINKFVEL